MTTKNKYINLIIQLANEISKENVGDKYEQALKEFSWISNQPEQAEAEYYISKIRTLAREADIGWKIFSKPPTLSQKIKEEEIIQVMVIISTLHAFCYGCERLDEASFVTGYDSTPVRFYINSLYHYIASLFLLDKGKYPIGGMIYKTLLPMGLAYLLEEIKTVIEKPMADGVSFGDTVKNIRNDFLVHGSFSPKDVSKIIIRTRLMETQQQYNLTRLIWELFNRSFILKLKLLAILTTLNVNPLEIAEHYSSKI